MLGFSVVQLRDSMASLVEGTVLVHRAFLHTGVSASFVVPLQSSSQLGELLHNAGSVLVLRSTGHGFQCAVMVKTVVLSLCWSERPPARFRLFVSGVSLHHEQMVACTPYPE